MMKIQHETCNAITGSISEISKLISDGMAPKDICSKLNICPETPLLNEEPSVVENQLRLNNDIVDLNTDPSKCAGCTLLVMALEAPIKAGNFTMQSLTWAVDEICENIPIFKFQRDLCGAITGSISVISKLVADGIAPKDVCSKLSICPVQPTTTGFFIIILLY